MSTKLDVKTELIKKINCLSNADIQKLKLFMAGMEAGKSMLPSQTNETQKETA